MNKVRRSLHTLSPAPRESTDDTDSSKRRGLGRLVLGCFAPRTLDTLDATLPTFAGPQAPRALVALPLPLPPQPRYLPIPQNPLRPELAAKLTAKVTQELDGAQALGMAGRALESQLRKTVWKGVLGSTLTAGNGSTKHLSKELAALNAKIEEEMASFKAQAPAAVPGTPERDIARACTNIWPMLCLQALDGRPLTVTGAMLGFSMLYPLTDDVIDEPSLSKAAKKDFLSRFGRLISHGDALPAADSPREQAVWRMFRLIEKDWPRAQHALTYRAMGELLQAQVDSQLQLAGPRHGDRPVPDDAAVWEVTVRKGALSILCDAFLVKGDLTPAEASFAAHFGLMTQFLNDIRTVDEDLAEGQYTPFNLLSQRGHKLDEMVDHVFHHFLTTFETEAHAKVVRKDPVKQAFMRVMLSFLSFKLIEGVAINQDKFSARYLSHLEREASPMPLGLIKRLYDAQFRGDNMAASIAPSL